jgi:hypothetical protein
MIKGTKKYSVAIDKRYFIESNSNRFTSVQFKPVNVFSDSRKNAALKVWEQNSDKWLKEIKKECKIISLYVSSGKTVFWRMPLVNVFKRGDCHEN